MNKLLMFGILFQFTFSLAYSQIKITKELAREINEQVFDSDNRYPKTYIQTSKRFEALNGEIKKEVIVYSDSTEVINSYNEDSSLTSSKVFKRGELKSTYNYEYKPNGKTLTKERGIYNLDFTAYKEDEYSIKYYVIRATQKQKGLLYRNLDTLFINVTKYSYELKRISKSKKVPVKECKFKYNQDGYLKSITVYENKIKVGHLINFYNDKNQVEKQELFWDYEWFYEDTELSFVGNFIYKIEYS